MLTPLVASAAARGMWAPDEPRYAQVAREAFETGQLVVMHRCGEIYPDKPPLLFWIAGLAGWLTDWNELAMRLVSIVSAAGTAWLVARLARRWWGEAEARWAPALFLGTALVTDLGGRLQLDPLLCLLCAAALERLSAPARDASDAGRNWIAAGACVGLAVLTKGPVAFVHVALPLIVWRWARVAERGERPRALAVTGALAAALLPAVAWASAASLLEPSVAAPLFFGQHLGRAIEGEEHRAPPWKYLLDLPVELLPWTIPFALGLAGAWRGWRAHRRGESADVALARAGLWFAALFAFFSALPVKRSLYLLPAVPAAALVGARWWTSVPSGARSMRIAGWFAVAIYAVLALGLSAAGPLADRIRPGALELAWRGPLAALPIAVAAALAARSLWRGSPHSTGWGRAILLGWAAGGALLGPTVLAEVDREKSGRELAHALAARRERPTAIPCFGVHPEAYRFYGGVPAVAIDAARPLEQVLAEARARDGTQMLALVRTERFAALPEDVRRQYRELARDRVGSRDLIVVGIAPRDADAETSAASR